jgi:hypothetical protein
VLRFGWLLMLTGGLHAAFGCGGRTDALLVPDTGNATGAAVGAGGTPGGSGSGGAAPHSGGFVGAGGKVGAAGFVGSGGGPACGPCPLIACGTGQRLTTRPGQCCATCEPCNTACGPQPLCPAGTQSVTTPGQCCPSCEPCGLVDCALPNCGPLGVATTLPGQCCPVCVMSDPCAGVRCDKMTCPSGTSLTTFPGKCCPVCTPNIVDASPGPCDQAGFAAYLQKQIVGLDARSCMVDGDCTTLPMVDACRSGCATAVNTKSIMSIYAAVQQFASTYCTGCAPTPGTCATGHPSCVNGQCTSPVLPL